MSQSIDPTNNRRANDGVAKASLTHTSNYYYGITFKPTYGSYIKKCKDNNEYISHMFTNWMLKIPGKLNDCAIEFDSLRVPHIHATVVSHQKLEYKKMMEKGIHIYIEQIYDLTKWYNYCHKDEQKTDSDYQFIMDD